MHFQVTSCPVHKVTYRNTALSKINSICIVRLVPVIGINCDVDINECESNPCKNGAECIDGVNEYTCSCKAGFTGPQCQVNIDECALYSPCQNGASCIGELHCKIQQIFFLEADLLL